MPYFLNFNLGLYKLVCYVFFLQGGEEETSNLRKKRFKEIPGWHILPPLSFPKPIEIFKKTASTNMCIIPFAVRYEVGGF